MLPRYTPNIHQELQQLVHKKLNVQHYGTVQAVEGGIVHIIGLKGLVSIGNVCVISEELDSNNSKSPEFYGEVISFDGPISKVLVSGGETGIKFGMFAKPQLDRGIKPSEKWLGKVIDAFGCVLDEHNHLKKLPDGNDEVPLKGLPPLASARRGLGERLETHTHFMNSFLPICRGQRIGLFAGSGVGKSTLLSHLAKNIEVDVVVVALIGERGREVNEFIHKTLTPEMQKKCVIVAISSDQSALLKRRGSYLSLAIAEYFRDQGKSVLLLFDSLTRLAEAQRQIGLMAGEPPAMRAFPPSSFTEVMGLCERAGPGTINDKGGDITAIFTVLVQGGDMEEPIADCVRGTLDGHIIMDRVIAERGLYPAVDILKSVSRSLPDCATPEQNKILQNARRLLAEYKDVEPMVRLGVYKKGSSPMTDLAVDLYPQLEDVIHNLDKTTTQESFEKLQEIFDPKNK